MPRNGEGKIDWAFVIAVLTFCLLGIQLLGGSFVTSSASSERDKMVAQQFDGIAGELSDIKAMLRDYQQRATVDEAELAELRQRVAVDEATRHKQSLALRPLHTAENE